METSRKTISEPLILIKENCKLLLVEALTKNDNTTFELIDPLLSDNQCHVHSVLIIYTLLKCYQYDKCSFNVKRLQQEDIELLSDAVLLTLLKINNLDGFGMLIRQESLENFGGYLESKKSERRFIAKIKENFNSKSIQFLKKIAKNNVKRILDDCSASIPHSKIKLQILPCYASLYALITFVKDKRIPIVISLKRIELKDFPSDIKYSINSTDIFYYKWNGAKFQYLENLNKCETIQPCITFESYSLYNIAFSSLNYNSKYQNYIDNKMFPSKSFFRNCDISHLIMASLSTHSQLSQSQGLTIKSGYCNGDEYIHSMYNYSSTESAKQFYTVESQFESNGTNVYEQYLAHLNLANDFNCKDSQYSRFCNRTAIRRVQNTFFGVRHAHVSNYSSEHSKLLGINTNIVLDRFEIFSDINKETAVLNILNKLRMDPGLNVNIK